MECVYVSVCVCVCVCVCVRERERECVCAEYMLKDPNAPAAFTSPVLPGDLMPTGADADLMMAQLSSLVYTSNAAAGTSLSLSYKGKCSTVVVKAAFMRNSQRSWVVYLPDMAAVAIVFVFHGSLFFFAIRISRDACRIVMTNSAPMGFFQTRPRQ